MTTKRLLFAFVGTSLVIVLKTLVAYPPSFFGDESEMNLPSEHKKSLVDLRDVSSELRSLVFLHVPKCGGSTVKDRIEKILPAKWKLRNLQKQTTIPLLNKNYWVSTYTGTNGPWQPSQLSNNLTQEERNGIRVLSGHLAYGACRLGSALSLHHSSPRATCKAYQ